MALVILEMDTLFEKAPIFVPGSPFVKVGDRFAAERELRHGITTFCFFRLGF